MRTKTSTIFITLHRGRHHWIMTVEGEETATYTTTLPASLPPERALHHTEKRYPNANVDLGKDERWN